LTLSVKSIKTKKSFTKCEGFYLGGQ